jgi:arabinogalactan oligomer/maltooligosaccharide transport system substrate-binding protein
MKTSLQRYFFRLCVILTLLAVCAGCTPDSKKSTTLTIWHDKEDEVAAVLQACLSERVPEIPIQLVRKEGLTEALKLAGNDPSAAPDLFIFAHDKVGLFAELGILEPVTNLLPDHALDQYLPLTVSAASYNGKVYQLPLYFETLLFMYNRAFMSDSDVPQTTEALYAYMQKHTIGNHYGFVEQHSTPYYSAAWIHGFGGTILHEDGTPGLSDPETIAALEYHRKFLSYMPGESEYSTVNTLFLQSMSDSIIGGPWLVPSVRERGIDLGFASMPIVDETGLPLSPYLGVQGVYVLKTAVQKKTDRETVEKVLACLLEPETGTELAIASGCAPAAFASYDNPAVTGDPMVTAMRLTAEKAIPMPNRPEMDIMFTITGNMLVKINMKNEDIRQKADEYQAKALKLIAARK